MDVKTGSGDHDRYYHFDYQVDDPRQNLNEADWAPTDDDGHGHSHHGHHHKKKDPDNTLGSRNNSDSFDPTPGGDSDIETGALDPWDVSTA